MYHKKVTSTILMMLMFIFGAFAQSNGKISGYVTDAQSNEPLVGANVILEGTAMGASSNREGYFIIENVPAGQYVIVVSYIGYRDTRSTVTIAANQTIQIDVALQQVGLTGEAVVVSASRKVEKLTEAPSTIEVITARQLENHPSFNSAELFAQIKGVDYVRAGVLGIGINVRGFNSAFNPKNLQMNDWRLSTLIATGLPMGNFTPTVKEDVEQIEVILGPSATLYGPNAHNGLVNTITKDPRRYPGTTIAIGGGNQSVKSGRFRHAQVINEKLAFKVTGEYTEGEEFDYVDSVYIGGVAYEELDLDRGFNSLKGEAALYFTPRPNHDIILGYGGSNSNNLAQTNAGRNQIKDWQIHYIQGRYVSPHLFAQVYHTWSKTDSTYAINQRTQNYQSYIRNGFGEAEAREKSYRTQYFPLSPTSGIDLPRGAIFVDDSRRINGELQYNHQIGGAHYIIGSQFQRDYADSKGTYLLDSNGPIELDQIGIYGQVSMPLGESGLKATLAARYDDHELYGSNFIPKAALLYETQNGTWRLTYGKGIAAPTILNLSGNLFGGLLLGNGEGFTLSDGSKVEPLKVETIQTIEAGYKGIINRKVFLDVNGYYNFSENFLSPLVNIATNGRTVTHRGSQSMSEVIPGTPPTGAAFLLTYLNFGKVNTYGADLGINVIANNEITLSLNYSYFNYDIDENDPNNDGNRDGKVNVSDLPINTPKHKANFSIKYNKDKIFGSILTRYVAEYDFFSGINVAAKTNPELIYNGDPVIEGKRVGRDFNEGPLGGFVTFDVSAGYRISPLVTIAGQVVNLFDSEVREFVASPSIGRLVSVELKLTF
jgi:iron complex outermembrane receptor protein